ncbi:hypothetical protein, partial [Paraburkholderia sp. SIMBA_030]|uniref:hypothetical protein n=1 Tax=Paraburkholderia sp. SIMBA_030 TaxID=3085773 RepID=UPI00397B3082
VAQAASEKAAAERMERVSIGVPCFGMLGENGCRRLRDEYRTRLRDAEPDYETAGGAAVPVRCGCNARATHDGMRRNSRAIALQSTSAARNKLRNTMRFIDTPAAVFAQP